MSANQKKVPLTGAERAKRFYDKNKESERIRTNEYYKNKRIAQGFPPPKKQKSYPKPSTDTPSSTQTAASQATSSTQPPASSKTYNTISTQTDFEPEPEPISEPEPVIEQVKPNKISALEKISVLINSIPNQKKGNIKFKVDAFKTIIRILKTPLYKAFITKITSNPNIVIKSIKEAEYRGKKYATRSILAYFNCILFLLDQYPDIKITKDKKMLYKNQSDILNYVADEEGDEKKQKLAEIGGLPSYADYTDKIIETFGKEGREYLITELYREIKARDNLVMKVVKSRDEAVDDGSYLIMSGGPQAEVLITGHKTNTRHGEFDIKLSTSLTSLIRKYLKNNKIPYNDFLFNTKSLSVMVGRMNKKLNVIGYGATNVFRKMLQTDSDKSGASPEERLQLAKELKHSMATAKKSYVIKKK